MLSQSPGGSGSGKWSDIGANNSEMTIEFAETEHTGKNELPFNYYGRNKNYDHDAK